MYYATMQFATVMTLQNSNRWACIPTLSPIIQMSWLIEKRMVQKDIFANNPDLVMINRTTWQDAKRTVHVIANYYLMGLLV